MPQIVSRALALVALFFTLICFLPAVPAICGAGPRVTQDRAPAAPFARDSRGDAQRSESAQKASSSSSRTSAPDGSPGFAPAWSPPALAPIAFSYDVAVPDPAPPSRRAERGRPAVRSRPAQPRAPPSFA